MNTVQYLDFAKKHLGLPSDYALAKRLEVTPQAISKLRQGHQVMGNTIAAKLAELLGVETIKVIADLELERGTNDELWTRIAKRVAIVSMLAIGAGFGAPPPAQAMSGGFNNNEITVQNGPVIHIVSNRRRRKKGQGTAWELACAMLAALAGLAPRRMA